MASKAVFVSDFRASITAMLGAVDRVEELVTRCATMGWTVDDFTSELSGSDITPAQLMDAINACQTLFSGEFETIERTLSTLMP